MTRNGLGDVRLWVRGGQEVINRLDVERFGIQKSNLKLVLLFIDGGRT